MSSALKITTAISGLAVFATAAAYSTRQTSDFSKNALAAAEQGASELTEAVKPKLPSHVFQYTRGDFKFGNVRA
ncbi:hypothetical protein LTR56_025640 [Elasticomyces elasticus]|uniref:Uncharacterized protein n=1 Tax=Elasticomyces elasticus TaxID=574655 RepID=A0AAN7W7B3_9PEZI|nr:hypothetical protein LTR56_025728 [Elasticomyces elasticus]KAK3616922.1 hypothetical protein LTR56_025640 [Elasticomyces elasticus]KAK3632180.1 hypothetical protein LTR22_020692 [Elasticomyces elasticus]KAK4904200.1 hypothetical protein LTR49_026290 [Elasticomyces elasticus]KAK4952743.1 hypothetical protein LTR10_009550 [Elasticomyces elasticus]